MDRNRLFIAGDDESITAVIDFIKDNDLVGKDKLWLFDFFPGLDKDYEEEHFKGGL